MQNRRSIVIVASVCAFMACFASMAVAQSAVNAVGPLLKIRSVASAQSLDGITKSKVMASWGNLPVGFEANRGQTDSGVQFLARGMDYTLFLTPVEAVLVFPGDPLPRRSALTSNQPVVPKAPGVVELRMLGANPAADADGEEPLQGRNNYFIGSDSSRWHTDIPTWSKVRYRDVYPGIDLLYYGNQHGQLEHDFILAPHADPGRIAFDLRSGGASALKGPDGSLILRTKSGNVTLHAPLVWQDIAGHRVRVAASYQLAHQTIHFKLGEYDRDAPLVIDPVVGFTGVFGDQGGNSYVTAVAGDSAGNVFVTGNTTDFHFPVVPGYVNPWNNQSGDYVAFVAEFNAAGTALIYCNIFAAGSYQFGTYSTGLAVDLNGYAYITGSTGAPLPTMNAYQPTWGGATDAYIAVFNTAGNGLVYSTYLGGGGYEYATALALDASDNAYITGYMVYPSGSKPFPRLHSLENDGGGGVFVAKYNKAGVLQYSSVFGSTGIGAVPSTVPNSISVDTAGAAYVGGYTIAAGIPTKAPAFQGSCASNCGFVTKLNPSGDSLGYSTYFPRTVNAIAVDSSGQAYVAGTTGAGFPAHQTAFQKTYGGGASDGYVAKLNGTGSALVWSTYLGGSGTDTITGMALDRFRTVYVTGYTNSPNFPWKAAVQAANPATSPDYYPFVTTLNGSLGAINYYSTDYGYGSANSGLVGSISVDYQLNAWVGNTTYGEIVATPDALNEESFGNASVAVTKFVTMDDLSVALTANPNPVHSGSALTYTIAVESLGPDFGYDVRISDTLPAGSTLVSYTAGGGTCTAPPSGSTGTINCLLTQLNAGSKWTVTLTVHVAAPAGSHLTNTAATISNMQDFYPANNSATLTVPVN